MTKKGTWTCEDDLKKKTTTFFHIRKWGFRFTPSHTLVRLALMIKSNQSAVAR